MWRISKWNTLRTAGAVSVVLALVATGAAFAQPQPAGTPGKPEGSQAAQMGNPAEGQPAPGDSRLERVHQMIGWSIVNKTGEKLGTLDDLVLNDHDMSISYGAMSRGGVAGVGDKLFAVPWSDFEVHPENKTLVIDIQPDALKNAQGFDQNRWPSQADKNWAGRAGMSSSGTPADRDQGQAGQTGGMSGAGNTGMAKDRARSGAGQDDGMTIPIKYRRVSQLFGLVARDRQGRELADLQDVIVDVHEGRNEGRVAYGVLAIRSGFMDLSKKMAVVPWTAVEVAPSVNGLRIDTTKSALEGVAFDEDHFPNLQDQRYVQDLHRRFEAKPYWEALAYAPNRERAGAADSDIAAWRADSPYNKRYDASHVSTIQGTIENMETFKPEPNALEGVSFRMRTQDNQTVTVQAGPRPFMDRQALKLANGDKVTVTGSQSDMGGMKTYIASKIQKDTNTLVLRGDDGKPRWNADRLMGGQSGAASRNQPGQGMGPGSPNTPGMGGAPDQGQPAQPGTPGAPGGTGAGTGTGPDTGGAGAGAGGQGQQR